MSNRRDLGNSLLWRLHRQNLDAGIVGAADAAALPNLSPARRAAMPLGDLIGQIPRNGFQLWITNGYAADHGGNLLAILEAMATPAAFAVRTILVEVAAIGKTAARLERLGESEHTDKELDLLAVRCEELDARFAELSPELERDVERYLEHLPPEPGMA